MSAAGSVTAALCVARRLGPIRSVGAALVILGLGVAAVGAVLPPEEEVELPFSERLVPVEEGAPEFEQLASLVSGARLEQVELVARSTGVGVAKGTLVRRGDAPPVLLGWHSELAEPILYPEIHPSEEIRLAGALRRHLPPGVSVFALPERSRRLVVLADVTAPLAAADDSAGLYLPEPWRRAEKVVRAHERARAGLRKQAEADAAFAAWLDALLAPPEEGVARLQVLSGGREAYLVLHLADAFTIGLLRPRELAVGLRDFPGGAAVHDSVRLVKSWVREAGHAAYAVAPKGREALRVTYLAGGADTYRLIAHVLPFDVANLGALRGIRLVFQDGGYWVWRIEPVVGASEKG